MIGIRIEGMDQLQRKLSRDITPELRDLTRGVALDLQGRIAPYPPATQANWPVYNLGPHRKPSNYGRWYQRGFGPRWSRKDGSVGGSKTSEMMNRQWAIRQTGRYGQIVGNRASYANWVHAEADQAAFHKARGWVTDRMAIQRTIAAGTIGKLWSQMMRRLWR